MTVRWSERDTLKLIQLYKSYEFLWNRNVELYKNHFARKQAYDAIVTEMNIPQMSSQDVRCKIKNLRTSYYQELRKMAGCRAKNKPFKPLRWFMEFKPMMGNLRCDVSGIRAAGTSKIGDSNSESEEFEEEEDQPSQVEESLFIEESTSNSDAYVVSIKQEFLDEMDNLGDKIMPPTICDYLEPVVPKRSKPTEPAKKPVKDQDMSMSLRRSKNLDEFQMFANNIAQQLRKLPLDRALNLQVEVQTMIAKERIEVLKKQEEARNDDEDSS